MKPIKKGMTEAITRDGRKVTQLTWFEIKNSHSYKVYGVLDNYIFNWKESGKFSKSESESENDIFAIPEYEYQVLYEYNGLHLLTQGRYTSKEDFAKVMINISYKFIEFYEPTRKEIE
jgi:hypothetical protein